MDRDRDDDRKCEQQIRNAERKLHDAERKHGEHSRQARSRRRDLENARDDATASGTTIEIMTTIAGNVAKRIGANYSLIAFGPGSLPSGLFFFLFRNRRV